MKDFDQILSEVELENVSGGLSPLAGGSDRAIAEEQVSRLIARLKEEGYTLDQSLSLLARDPRSENTSVIMKASDGSLSIAIAELLAKKWG